MSWRARATCGKAFPIASSCVALTAQQRRLQRVSAHSLMCMCSQRHGTLCCSMRLFCVTSTCVRLQSWRETHVRAWMCSKSDCRVVNKATDPRCAACGEAKPNLLGWKCEVCATRNFSGVKLCKQCKSSVELSREMWMCSSCGENNRIDELEDNSLCGFCGYDMAPLSASAEALLRESQEESERRQAQQESFDQISPRMADEQVGNELAGAEVLPSSLQRRMHAVQRSPKLVVKKFEPFTTPKTMGTSHSKLRRMVDRAQRGQALTSNAPAGPPGFDWMCRAKKCQHISPGDEEVCMQCAAPFAAEDWECPHCAAINHKSRSRCFSCDAPIPVSWSCTKCEGVVSIYDKTCCHCETERPPAQPKGRRDAQASFGAGAGRQRDSERGDWYCEACSAMNFGRRTECFQCRNPRPESATSSSNHRGSGGGGSVERSSSGHNNWKCAGCQSSNFRTRTTCWQCGMAPASEAHRSWSKEHDVHFDKEGFQDAPDSKPAEGTMNTWRKTDDWTCAKCFAKNFRTRGECHKCGSLKISVSPKKVATRRPVKI